MNNEGAVIATNADITQGKSFEYRSPTA